KPRPVAQGQDGRVKATPAVRALARKLNVDLTVLTPSGPDGVITSKDVEAAAGGAALVSWEPLRGVRRTMAQKMSQSRDEICPASLSDEADVHDWAEGTDISVRLIRAVCAACRAEPALNAWFDGHELARHLNESVDLGIAVNTEEGLFVPVLRGAEEQKADQLRGALETIKRDVQSRQIKPEDLRGQTITLSNFGMIAGRHATLSIVPPQVAIIGAGRVQERVVAVNAQAAVRRTIPLSLTFDHRAVSGGEAGRFMAAMIADLNQPE
ncbi:MAG: dihydrolipoamide acetyltransferase family protein, partial [Rhodospirillales bacterium]